MIMDKEIVELISALEPIVAQCYYNEQERGGHYLRYPVILTINGENYKFRGGRLSGLSLNDIMTLHYQTGANKLFVGCALAEVLQFLENRYGIDFAEMEKNCHKELFAPKINPEHYRELSAAFESFEDINDIFEAFFSSPMSDEYNENDEYDDIGSD